MTLSEYLYPGFLVLSIVLLLMATWMYSKTRSLLESGLVANGKVIDLIESSSNGGYSYKPVFEFTDHTNTKITFEATYSSSPPTHNVGEDVKVIYSSTDDKRKIISFWGLYRWTIVLLCIAAPFFIIGFGHFLYERG